MSKRAGGGFPVSRPRKPSALKLVTGTDRADRRNSNEPEPPLLNDLNPPPSLAPESAAVWREVAQKLRDMQVLTVVDTLALEMLCDAVADYRQARQERGGSFTKTSPKGGQMLDQLLVAQQMAGKRAETLMAKFGMDPAARSRVLINLQGDLFGNQQPPASGPGRFFGGAQQ
jgi:P27 family predicted phage terminase small subunit